MYQFGEGVPINRVLALQWYQQAAIQGNAMAQYNLGSMYLRGESIPESRSDAIRWFDLAARQGEPNAQFTLTLIYVESLGLLAGG